MDKWHDTVVDAAIEAAEQGHSAAQIAAQLSAQFGHLYSRNSIMGKLHRMGVRLRGCSRLTKQEKRAKARASRRAVIPKKIHAALQSVAAPDSNPVALLAANNNQCRYFLDCGNCCGAVVFRRSFCGFHYFRCYPIEKNAPQADNQN